MNLDAFVSGAGLPVATFWYCVVAGFVPAVNAEVFLVAVAATAPPAALPSVVVTAALGQMAAKAVLYLAGRGVVHLPLGRRRASLEAVRARVERWRSRDLLMLASATAGIPPLYATTLIAGSLRFPFARFLLLGTVGRIVRFAAIVALPPLGRWIAALAG